MKIIVLYFFLFLCTLTSCLHTVNDKLARSLNLAGDNREELFKVLLHYKNRNDTLKYKAALFLIENMSYHYSQLNKNRSMVESAMQTFLKEGFIHPDTLEVLYENCSQFNTYDDVQIIKADFLIRNIDMAFDAWQKRPWGKYYTFDEFCEYLLPYRVLNEPLEEWREMYAKRFAYILDSLYTGTDVIEAANTVCKVLKEEGYIHTMKFSPLGAVSPLFIADHRIGDCADECNFTIFVMRSLGIPIQSDFYDYSPETFSSHGWCVVLDTTKLNIPLYYSDFFAKRGSMETDDRRKCKIYRRTYAIQEDVLETIPNNSFPTELKDLFRVDVSDEYFDATLTLPITDGDKTYFLGTFKREKIIPIVKGDIENNTVSFGVVEDKNIFILLSGSANDLKLESAPFIFRKNGIHYLIPDTNNMKNESLYRKYLMSKWNQERMYRVIRGRFYAGNQMGDINHKLYEICDTPYVCYNHYPLGELGTKQRYIRYIARDSVYLELAELHFYNGKYEVKPQRVLAGEPYDRRDPAMQLKNCFDHDPLTYYLSKNKGDSIIFDFGKEVNLTHAVCVPRNDDNFIRIGDEYELFYFDSKKGWIPLLKQVATQTMIPCCVPDNCLLLLRDRTRGKEEQIFYFDNHKQIYINDIQ